MAHRCIPSLLAAAVTVRSSGIARSDRSISAASSTPTSGRTRSSMVYELPYLFEGKETRVCARVYALRCVWGHRHQTKSSKEAQGKTQATYHSSRFTAVGNKKIPPLRASCAEQPTKNSQAFVLTAAGGKTRFLWPPSSRPPAHTFGRTGQRTPPTIPSRSPWCSPSSSGVRPR
jgi:hypothetical protein